MLLLQSLTHVSDWRAVRRYFLGERWYNSCPWVRNGCGQNLPATRDSQWHKTCRIKCTEDYQTLGKEFLDLGSNPAHIIFVVFYLHSTLTLTIHEQEMMSSILQMRKGQLQCNATSQWSDYVYIAGNNSRMMLSAFMTSHPASAKRQ